jgi:hypothetical protein
MPPLLTFGIEEKKWEAEFFNKKWGLLTCKDFSANQIVEMPKSIVMDLEQILEQSDQSFDLLEFQATHDLFMLIPYIETAGFRFVDSKISFKTLLSTSTLVKQQFPLDFANLKLKLFSVEYLSEIISLTNKHLTNNPLFVSRYKNPLFMESNAAEKYFTTWVTNALTSEHSISCVVLDQHNFVKGYFIYERKGSEDSIPIYKGILTVIDDEYRGKSTHLAMQSFLFSQIKEAKYFVDNTTQLTNLPVIRNHVKSHRSLNSISLTFYRSNPLNINSL